MNANLLGYASIWILAGFVFGGCQTQSDSQESSANSQASAAIKVEMLKKQRASEPIRSLAVSVSPHVVAIAFGKGGYELISVDESVRVEDAWGNPDADTHEMLTWDVLFNSVDLLIGGSYGIDQLDHRVGRPIGQTISRTGHSRLTISSDERYIASAGTKLTLSSWEDKEFIVAGALFERDRDAPVAQGLTFLNNDRQLAIVYQGEPIEIWQVPKSRSGSKASRITTIDPVMTWVRDLTHYPDDTLLWVGNEPGVWSAKVGWDAPKIVAGEKTRFNELALSPDGELLAARCWDGGVKVYRLPSFEHAFDAFASPEQSCSEPQELSEIQGLAFFPDSDRIAVAGSDSRVRVISWE